MPKIIETLALWGKQDIPTTKLAEDVIRTDKQNRQIFAHNKILDFLSNENYGYLALRGLDLSTLPDIFHNTPFTRQLQSLDLSQNQLTSLPQNINKLKALHSLRPLRKSLIAA